MNCQDLITYVTVCRVAKQFPTMKPLGIDAGKGLSCKDAIFLYRSRAVRTAGRGLCRQWCRGDRKEASKSSAGTEDLHQGRWETLGGQDGWT